MLALTKLLVSTAGDHFGATFLATAGFSRHTQNTLRNRTPREQGVWSARIQYGGTGQQKELQLKRNFKRRTQRLRKLLIGALIEFES